MKVSAERATTTAQSLVGTHPRIARTAAAIGATTMTVAAATTSQLVVRVAVDVPGW